VLNAHPSGLAPMEVPGGGMRDRKLKEEESYPLLPQPPRTEGGLP
jgi:hypothetical protein